MAGVKFFLAPLKEFTLVNHSKNRGKHQAKWYSWSVVVISVDRSLTSVNYEPNLEEGVAKESGTGFQYIVVTDMKLSEWVFYLK